MENLIGNAWKYTSAHDRARIRVRARQNNGRPAYFVRDDGAGFDRRYVDRLFGAFQRLHAATEFPGTGIGLATVQRIIHRHGGEVWAEGGSRKWRDILFHLVTAKIREEETTQWTTRTILLVEDNPDDEALTLRALRKNNIRNEVVVAHDGVEALDYLFGTGTFAGRNVADFCLRWSCSI